MCIFLLMKSDISRALLPVCFALAVTTPALAGNQIEKQLNSDYADKLLTLRRFYEGDHLRFHSDGRLFGDAPIGPWTLDSRIAVKGLHLKEHALVIKGRRVHVVFESSDKTLKPADWIETLNRLPDKERKAVEKSVGKLEAEIEIDLPANATEQDISSAMHAVFLMPGESMIDTVPDCWRRYFAELEGHPDAARLPQVPKYAMRPSPQPGAFRVSNAVYAPRAVSAPDPEYAEQARRARFQGTDVLWLIVGPDGLPRNIQVARPLGMGLDEKAVEAVSTWKFDPATKGGEPVAVQINVEVSFHLY